MNNQILLEASPFAEQLASALIRQARLENSPNRQTFKNIIIFLEENLAIGNSTVALSEIETLFAISKADLVAADKLFCTVSKPREITNITQPICLYNNTLSFTRQLKLEAKIAEYLRTKQHNRAIDKDLTSIDNTQLQTLDFYQRLAVISAYKNPFCLIKGGAGTGKTTTLCSALVAILRNNPNSKIYVTAPTGKATNRLQESIGFISETLPDSDKANLATINMLTLHRFLGLQQESGLSFYNKRNPILCDVLAIDEASMLSSDLFAQILEAVPAHCQIILLGDENQLPPVKATSFFNEIAQLPVEFSEDYLTQIKSITALEQPLTVGAKTRPLLNQQIKLHNTFRFGEESSVAKFADLLLNDNSETFINALNEDNLLKPIDDDFWTAIKSLYPTDKTALLAFLDTHIILCAKRQGSYSSEAINAVIDALIKPILVTQPATIADSDWYPGRRILFEKNNYELNIYNGDIGQCVEIDGQYFIDFGHSKIELAMLPNNFSLAFAISIHKSQGSEYEQVSIVLDKNDNPLLNRSLIYTAITRAKTAFSIYSAEHVLANGINKKSQPASNLLALLRS